MSTLAEQSALLDQLQQELNMVLETTGRMFVACNLNSKAQSMAQKDQLKRKLPGATNRFHASLDKLESQLHTARLVLCRDLAVCREQDPSYTQKQAANETEAPAAEDVKMDVETSSEQPVKSAEVKSSQDSDVTMAGVQDEPPTQKEQTDVAGDESKPAGSSESKSLDLNLDTSIDAKDTANGSSNEAKNDDDAAPQTAGTDFPADSDSLFGAAQSTGVDGEASGKLDVNNDFSFGEDNANETGDIDFSAFSDNDNISSLLPGLQDYANPQGGEGSTNFDDIFPPGDGDGAASGEANGFNFEEFMASNDFSGNAGNGTSDTNAAGKDGTADPFDFDALFN